MWEPCHRLEWKDVLYDLAWAEDHADVIITSTGGGSILMWNYASEKVGSSVCSL